MHCLMNTACDCLVRVTDLLEYFNLDEEDRGGGGHLTQMHMLDLPLVIIDSLQIFTDDNL